MRLAYYDLAWIAWIASVIHDANALMISPSIRPLRKVDSYCTLKAQLHNQYEPRHIKFDDNEGPGNNKEKSKRDEDHQRNDLDSAYQDLMRHIKKEEMDSIQQEYLDWCNFFNKKYDESRLPIFVHNYKELETWIDSGLVSSPHLNEWADRTEDEVREFIYAAGERVASTDRKDVSIASLSIDDEDDDSAPHEKKQYLPSNEKMDSVADNHETPQPKSSREESGSLLSTTPTLAHGPVEKKPNTSVQSLSSIRFSGPGQNKRASWRKEPEHNQMGFKTNVPDSETQEIPRYENPSFFEKDEIPSFSRNQQQPSKMASDQARIRKTLDDEKARLRIASEYTHTPFLLGDTQTSDHSFDHIDSPKGKSEDMSSSIQHHDSDGVDSSGAAKPEEPLGETIVVGSTITARRPPLREPVDSDSFSMSMNRSEQTTILRAYQDWCSYYNRAFQPTRISAFATNYESAQQYFKATGMTLKLNEYADMTEKEYTAMMEQEEAFCDKLEETEKDSDMERMDFELEAKNFLASEKQRMQEEDERINAAVEERIHRQAELDRKIKADAPLKRQQERCRLGSKNDAEENDEIMRLCAEHDARLQAEKRLMRGEVNNDDLVVSDDDDENIRIPEKPLWLDAAEADILLDDVEYNVDDEKHDVDDGKTVLETKNHATSDNDEGTEERATRKKSKEPPKQSAGKDAIKNVETKKGSEDDQHWQGVDERKTELKTTKQAEDEDKETSEDASLKAQIIIEKRKGGSEERFMVGTPESNLCEKLTIDVESNQKAGDNGETDEETTEEVSLKARIIAKRNEECKERFMAKEKSKMREEMKNHVKPKHNFNGKELEAREFETILTNGLNDEEAKVGVVARSGIDNEKAGARLVGMKPSPVSEVGETESESTAYFFENGFSRVDARDNSDPKDAMHKVDVEPVGFNDEAEASGKAETRADERSSTGDEADVKVGRKVANGTMDPDKLEALALAVKAFELAARKENKEAMPNEIDHEAIWQKTEEEYEEIRMCEDYNGSYAKRIGITGKGTDVVEPANLKTNRRPLSNFEPTARTDTQKSMPGKEMPEGYPDASDPMFAVEFPNVTAGNDDHLYEKIAALIDWKQNPDGTLTGLVKNLSGIKDGTAITTSVVEGGAQAGSIITTLEGAKYYLQ